MQAPEIPEGERVYAIGDIHGRLDLFEALIEAIERDDAERSPALTRVILLGDLVDRGPDSAGVVARARAWGEQRRVEFIKGNHEEMLIASLSDPDILRGFLRYGGLETIMSYGLEPGVLAEAGLEQLRLMMIDAIPAEDIDFLDSFTECVRVGDYLFVHAGVRPTIPLDRQAGEDRRWIREPFLSYDGDFGAFIIHGHTIAEDPQIRGNRIGIDTGAFLYGKLTAIGIEGSNHWFIQAREGETGSIATFEAAT